AEVAAAFGTAATTMTTTAPNPSTVVDVINAGSISGLAGEVSHALKKDGYTAGAVRERVSNEPTTTTIKYGPGADADAHNVATLLGIDAPARPDSKLKADHIQVIVDDNFSVPSQDETSSASTISGGYHQSRTTTSTEPTPDQGAPIDGGGVPCVN
ncbi:MAG: LytR C-terminal domain-containing protein, partial [Mycobacterium sp.]